MANRLMTRSEANEYCRQNGYKMFIDMCIEEKIIVQADPKITILFEEHHEENYGTITLLKRTEGLELWVGGKYRYSLKKSDV